MSNYLGIATVTATLQRMLQQSVQMDVEGARVTTSRPENTGGTPETGISIYLYHLKRNTSLGNADMPPRQRKGELTKRNQLPIDLYYLLSCYGNEIELEPQRLLGSAIRTLEDRAVLSSQMIRETVNDPSYPFLANSDLSEQIEMIRAEFVPVSTDELSKVWSVFFQTPYVLSVIYKITVVVLDGEEPAMVALPIRDRSLNAWTFSKQPTIDFVMSTEGRYQPIFSHSTLLIRGKMLANANASIRIGGVEVAPGTVQDHEITLALTLVPPEALRPGVQALQVIHGQRLERGSTNDSMQERVESNVAPFVLRPGIKEVNLLDGSGTDDEPRDAEVEVVTDVRIGQDQRVILILNEQTSLQPASYIFNAQPRNNNTARIVFSLKAIKNSNYLVRIQVDGAESLCQIDSDRHSPTFDQYISPTITIP
ncbi:MAG: DUF4255 domain-containing protein [Planktothrix agardhii KL2]|uniref:DUF4255 domain-containing protein n=1 Tax=Planktothrix agardhii TaxID=1160 RepID=UPI001A23E413|nr:DUF4255 domain-containing protein [Planktothrix agardhii]MBG0746150.1 DUF4255 domain-containing protein [Planktothrix agardhii KL2]